MNPRIPLAQMARASGKRRTVIVRPIRPPATMAGELARISTRVTTAIAAQVSERLLPEYVRSIAGLTTDSAADLNADLDEVGSELQRLVLRLTPAVREWAFRVEGWHRGRFAANIKSAASVDLSTMIGRGDVAETLEIAIARNVRLIRNVGDQAQGRIADAVFRGLNKRTPVRDVARELSEAVSLGKARATRIASDQLVKITSELDRERQQQAGIERYQWQHSAKAHPRPEHEARDGNEYAWGELDDEPGEEPFCGCVAAPLLSLDD